MSIARELAKRALEEYDAMNEDAKHVLQALNDINTARNNKDIHGIGVAEGRGLIYAEQLATHRRELGRLLMEIAKT